MASRWSGGAHAERSLLEMTTALVPSARAWFLLRTFPLFMWLSELFHRWLLHDQIGDD